MTDRINSLMAAVLIASVTLVSFSVMAAAIGQTL
jgi:hypothetical protein